MKAVDPRLLRHAAAARPFILLTAAISVVTAILVVIQAGVLSDTVARAFLGGAGLAALAGSLSVLAAVVAGRAALVWASEVAAHRAAAAVTAQLRGKLVEHVLALGPRHPDLPPSGELATLATRGVDGLDGYFSRYLPQLLAAAVVPLGVGVRILTADWVSAVIVGLTVPLIPLFMVLIGLHTKVAVSRQWRALAVLGHHFLDLVAGLDVLSAFGRAGRQTGRIREMTERYRETTLRTLRVAFLSALVLELLATLSVALIAVSVGLRLVDGQLDLATGLLVIVLAPEVYLPLRAVGARFHDSAEGLAAADAVFGVLDLPVADAGGTPAPDPSRAPLRLRAVRVDGRSGPVLDELSLEIAPGEVLGVAGPSGAGKSTLLDLLLGWRRPDRGQVEIDGVELSTVNRTEWLRQVAWVPQRPVLVAGTVADNLRLGRPSAGDEDLARAATAAALDLPLDAPVGERGSGLSTGQQRRVALARALLADRPLLLLDEPTEGIDADTETAVLAALPDLLAGRTAVVVSHRAAVLACCDRVVHLPGHPAPAPASAPAPQPAAHPTPKPTCPETVTAGLGDSHPPATGGALAWLRTATRPGWGRVALAIAASTGALGCGVALTATSAWLICAAALRPPVLTLMVAIVAVRTFGLAKGVLRYVERLTSHDAALRMLSQARVRVWQSLVRLGPVATARLRRGDLLARLVGDVDAQQDVLIRVLVPAASAILVGAGAAVALGLLLPTAGFALAGALSVAGLAAPALTVLISRAAARRTAAARSAVLIATVELVEASPDLVAFGAAPDRHRKLAALDRAATRLLHRAASASGVGGSLAVLAVGGATVACTALGIAALRAGTLGAGTLGGTALAVLALTPLATAELVATLPDAAQRLATALPATRRLAALEAAPAPVTEPIEPLPAPAGQRLATVNLAVRWPDARTDAVRGVELSLAPGQRLTLTGPSGCGKSTVLAALMRGLEPSAGAVLIDRVDTRRVRGEDLRTRIAWCGPGSHLFDTTLRQNLLLAQPHASDDELANALRRARLAEWVAELPDGLDTAIGAHGGAVSGGERQRIGIARALLADRPVLLLDEPTAHLDADNAAELCADLLTLTQGVTALIVTHRPHELAGLPQVRIITTAAGLAWTPG